MSIRVNSLKQTARLAGVLYVLMSILAIFSYLYVPAIFMVPGDAAATARKITEGVFLYRITILTALLTHVLFLFVVLTLYRLFRDVDRNQARLMVVLVCVGVAAELVVVANRMAPLVFLSGAEFLSVFTKPQLDALALASLRWGGNLAQIVTGFWGLWLFPFGLLVIRSGFCPRILGVLLMVAGVGYVVSCVVRVVFPEQLPVLSRFLTPLYFGELPIIFWLAILGAKVPQAEGRPAQVS